MADHEKSHALTALYYPFDTLNNPALLKTALLLWDQVECIAPHPNWDMSFYALDDESEEAADLICRPHVPTEDERLRAGIELSRLIREGLPTSLLDLVPLRDGGLRPFYLDFGFTESTWADLKSRGWAFRDTLETGDMMVAGPIGDLMTSVLADICASTTKQKITDAVDAYAWLEEIKARHFGARYETDVDASSFTPSLDRIVTISLQVLGAREIPMKRLLEFRCREARESSTDYRQLRLRYWRCLEEYVTRITTQVKTTGDILEIEREFREALRHDLSELKRELKVANLEVLFSKEVLLSALVSAGAFVEPISGLTNLALIVKGLGVAPLAKAWLDLRAKRRKAFLGHTMSWLYLTRSARVTLR